MSTIYGAGYVADIMRAEALEAVPEEWRRLYTAVNEMMAPLGYHGSISARDDRVSAVMDALADIDGGTPFPPA